MAESHDADANPKSIIDGLYDAAALLDGNLNVCYYNASYARMSGMRPRALDLELRNGATTFDIIIGESASLRSAAEKCLEESKPNHLAERSVRNCRGDDFVVWVSFLPVQSIGSSRGVIQIIRDVTGEAKAHVRLKELLALSEARAEDLERAVEQRTRELRTALDEVTRLSRIDPLTGTLNRRAFTECASLALSAAKRHARTVGVLMFDLDHFKRVNDTHGHQAGDSMLKAVAHALKGSIRESDSIGRFGGEEFVILLSETTPSGALDVATRCLRVVRELPMVDVIPTATRPQTISAGGAVFPADGETLDALIGAADTALYQAKHQGRDRCLLYELRMNDDAPKSSWAPRRRVLIVARSGARASAIETLLKEAYEVISTPSSKLAIGLLQQQTFDVIFAEQELDDDGVLEFLEESFSVSPGPVRILSVATQDFFLAVRATNEARVDSFVLEGDGIETIKRAIDDALMRRKIEREHLGRPLARDLYIPGAHELARIIDERNLDFAFQPIVRAQHRELFGYEALCRPPAYARMSPAGMFDLAAQTGDLWRLGRLARSNIATACSKLAPERVMFVNLHPGEMLDPELTSGRTGLEALSSSIVFEITERMAISDFPRFKSHMRSLRERGFRFAVDDLGSGYASLSSVALLEPDFLKIDMEIIRGIHRAPHHFNLVKRIVQFAGDVGIQVIAEGIEVEEEFAATIDAGCQFMQGYYLGRPGPLAQ